jgi:hypothetical protein
MTTGAATSPPAARTAVARRAAGRARAAGRSVTVSVLLLAALSATAALAGLLTQGGSGPRDVTTTRGVEVAVYGEGLYAWDTWLVGAGNRGQDVALLLVEVPVLLLVLARWRRGGAVVDAVLLGVVAFFAYFWVSMVTATAQNRAFPVYVACLGLALYLLLALALRLDVASTAAALPDRPGRRALAAYLLAVAAALTLAWLPGLVGTALTGDVAEAVGPYTSSVTEALDLGIVVPAAVVAGVLVLRRRPAGRVLALVMLVLNVCIGVLLMAQGVAQLVAGIPLTPAEIVAKMATFATLTLVAGGLLARGALAQRRGRDGGTSWARS